MQLRNPTMAGLYDTAGRRHGPLFIADADLFDRQMGDAATLTSSPAAPAAGNPWADAFANVAGEFIQYRRDKDLSKLNRELIAQGRAPVSAAQANNLAAQAPSQMPAWLPWAGAAAVGLFLMMQQAKRK